MTSFNDAALWQPFAPASSAVPAFAQDGTGFAPLAVTPAAGEASGWLPPLRSDEQAESEARIRTLHDGAYQRGFDDATRAERERAEARCATALASVAGVAAQLETIVAEFACDRERDVHAVAMAAARHIVQQEVAADAAIVGQLVRRAIELLPQDHLIEIKLHPADLATLEGALASMAPSGRGVTLQWSADAEVERGSFLVETPHRIIDGRTDTALRALYERFEHE